MHILVVDFFLFNGRQQFVITGKNLNKDLFLLNTGKRVPLLLMDNRGILFQKKKMQSLMARRYLILFELCH